MVYYPLHKTYKNPNLNLLPINLTMIKVFNKHLNLANQKEKNLNISIILINHLTMIQVLSKHHNQANKREKNLNILNLQINK